MTPGLGRRLPSNAADEQVGALSELLRRLPIHPPDTRADTYRNPGGVYLKLANFRALDPSTDRKGAAHFSRIDREVWAEFAHDSARLHDEAQAIVERYRPRDDAAPEVDETEDAGAGIASGYRRGRGQGFQTSPAARRAIEDEAMARAIAHFQLRGWDVEDVSRHASYDLHCTKPDRTDLRVEVKGTTGDGVTILLTANEVVHARQFHPRVALYVVTNLVVAETDAGIAVSGGDERAIEEWSPDATRLRPLSFEYRLNP